MKKLLTCLTLVEAQHCANLLASAGIAVEVRNTYLSGAVGDIPFIEAGPQVWVNAQQDSDHCRQIIAEAALPPDQVGWQCSGCGECSEAQFSQCWRCGSMRP